MIQYGRYTVQGTMASIRVYGPTVQVPIFTYQPNDLIKACNAAVALAERDDKTGRP